MGSFNFVNTLCSCAGTQGRTGDPSLFRRMLYQLSYPSKNINFANISTYFNLLRQDCIYIFNTTLNGAIRAYKLVQIWLEVIKCSYRYGY
jgi:hypothetical protein